MDTYEEKEWEPGPEPVPQMDPPMEEIPQEPPMAQTAQEPPRATSPFADSPYAQVPAGWKPEVPEKKKSGFSPLMAIALSLAMVIAGCSLTGSLVTSHWQEELAKQNASYQEKLDILQSELDSKVDLVPGQSVSGTPNATPNGSLTPAQVYAQNVKSVVAISCTVTTNSFGQTVQGTSSGSGFVLTEDGYIVTNYHVVDNATAVTVTTSDGVKYNAKYIGGDEFNDIALLKAEAAGLQAAVIGSSDNLIVGDQVVAIGNPLGELASTLTVGYISAKDRIITTDGSQISMLQTDAAINSGNSGGPLLNMLGQVVGITSAKYSGTSASGATIEGIGFAIPMDDVIGMLTDLKDHGYITGAYLGVEVSNMDPAVVETYGLPMGVLVRKVTEGSCAAKAGIQPQDIMVDLGGHAITNLTDLSRALRQFKAGDTVTVTVFRNGGERKLTVTLDEKPRQGKIVSAEPSGSGLPNGGSAENWFDYFYGGQ